MNRKCKYKHVFAVALLLILVLSNSYYEIFAFRPLADKKNHKLKVLTWNIHCPEGATENRQKRLAEKILEQVADYVTLIEYCSDSCSVLDSILQKSYKYYDTSASHTLCGNAIYSKIPLFNSKVMDTPHGAMYLQNVSSTICIDGDSIFIMGIHLPSNSGDGSAIINSVDSLKRVGYFHSKYKRQQEKRNWCMSFIKKWVLEHNHPAIVMGDFNDFSFSSPCDSLKDIGMKDSWKERGFGYGTTYHDGWMRLRIDHIFHSPAIKLCGVEIIETDLSDHNPIVAKFKLEQ